MALFSLSHTRSYANFPRLPLTISSLVSLSFPVRRLFFCIWLVLGVYFPVVFLHAPAILIVVFSVVLNNNLNRFVNNNLLNSFYLSFHTIKTFERGLFLKKNKLSTRLEGRKINLAQGWSPSPLSALSPCRVFLTHVFAVSSL